MTINEIVTDARERIFSKINPWLKERGCIEFQNRISSTLGIDERPSTIAVYLTGLDNTYSESGDFSTISIAVIWNISDEVSEDNELASERVYSAVNGLLSTMRFGESSRISESQIFRISESNSFYGGGSILQIRAKTYTDASVWGR